MAKTSKVAHVKVARAFLYNRVEQKEGTSLELPKALAGDVVNSKLAVYITEEEYNKGKVEAVPAGLEENAELPAAGKQGKGK